MNAELDQRRTQTAPAVTAPFTNLPAPQQFFLLKAD
jgi:hypothetical protein